MASLIRKPYIGQIPPANEAAGCETLLYANENPNNLPISIIGPERIAEIACLSFNRYPDCEALDLRKAYAAYLGNGLSYSNIAAGNGSDELIRSIGEVFFDYSEAVLSFEPAFSVYKRSASLAKASYTGINSSLPYNKPEVGQAISMANSMNAKAIFVCSPHNPLGYAWAAQDIIYLKENTNCLIVVDEAYIEFSEKESIWPLAVNDSRLIVLRTLSKAFSLASMRIGFAVSTPENIDAINCALDLYNINSFSQAIGIEALSLSYKSQIDKAVEQIKSERNRMFGILSEIKGITVYPSEGNFLYIKSEKAAQIAQAALEAGILIRTYQDPIHIRASVGTAIENDKLLSIILEI
ncbi:MAG: aminotransferase class I/II-fold pyridoxal phosphate-dependent enzyme [Eubacteriaceae bacterium]|nr:aminotransferase class I/II-fold pyridoxal phosphate-dependent enzyme [Eubacteriaceae bacterium]